MGLGAIIPEVSIIPEISMVNNSGYFLFNTASLTRASLLLVYFSQKVTQESRNISQKVTKSLEISLRLL